MNRICPEVSIVDPTHIVQLPHSQNIRKRASCSATAQAFPNFLTREYAVSRKVSLLHKRRLRAISSAPCDASQARRTLRCVGTGTGARCMGAVPAGQHLGAGPALGTMCCRQYTTRANKRYNVLQAVHWRAGDVPQCAFLRSESHGRSAPLWRCTALYVVYCRVHFPRRRGTDSDPQAGAGASVAVMLGAYVSMLMRLQASASMQAVPAGCARDAWIRKHHLHEHHRYISTISRATAFLRPSFWGPGFVCHLCASFTLWRHIAGPAVRPVPQTG